MSGNVKKKLWKGHGVSITQFKQENWIKMKTPGSLEWFLPPMVVIRSGLRPAGSNIDDFDTIKVIRF